MRVLIASEDKSLGEYIKAQGYETKTVFVNDVVLQAARLFSAEVVIYFTSVIATEAHEDVIKSLCSSGVRVILVAERDDPVRAYAAALGVTDLLELPVEPAEVLHRLKNPASKEEAAEAMRNILPAPQKETGAEKERPGFYLFRIPFLGQPAGKTPKAAGWSEEPGGRASVSSGGRESSLGSENTNKTSVEISVGSDYCREAGLPEDSLQQSPGLSGVHSSALSGAGPTAACYAKEFVDSLRLKGLYSVVFVELEGLGGTSGACDGEADRRVLAAFSRMLRENLKGKDIPVHWGGGEFVLILPDTEPKGAWTLAEKLSSVWRSCTPDAGGPRTGFSFGVAACEDMGEPEDIKDMIKLAAARMKGLRGMAAGKGAS